MDSGSDREESPPPLTGGYEWKRYRMQRLPHTISIYCREWCIGNIRTVLSHFGDDTLNEFKKCCFGRLYKLPEHPVRNNQAIHYILSREITRLGSDPTEMWFRVDDTNIRFSRFEYALVTGLKFGKSNFDPTKPHKISPNSFYSRVLKRKPLPVGELLERFSKKSLGNDPADYLKVAKVCFAYAIIFGYDTFKTNVADWIWVLVEDSKSFDSFPWGSYSYQILLHYLNKFRKEPTKAKRPNFHFYGFSTAFLAWIYCAIPRLGEKYGGILSTNKIPRILRFKYMRSFLEIEDISGEMYSTLEPIDEREQVFLRNIEPVGTPFQLEYEHYNPKKGPKKSKNKVVDDDEEEEDEDIVPLQKTSKQNKGKSHVVDDAEDEVEHEDEGRHDEGGPWVFTSPQRRAFVHEIADEVMMRIGEVLPRYNEFMQREANFNSRDDTNREEEPYQYWDIPAPDGEENMAWTSSTAHAGEPWGVGTKTGDSWHASRWGTQWTNDSYPLICTPVVEDQDKTVHNTPSVPSPVPPTLPSLTWPLFGVFLL